MKPILRELARRALHLALQLLAVGPMFIIASCGVAPLSRRLAVIGALGAATMCMALSFAPPKVRRPLFPALAALAGAGAFMLPAAEGQGALHLIFAALCAGTVVLLSVTQAGGVTIITLTAGVPLHLLAAVLANLEACVPVKPLLLPTSCQYLIGLIFYANWTVYSDQYNSHSQRPPTRMRLGNAAMSAVFLGLAFAILQFDRLRALAGETLRRVLMFILYVISLIVPTLTPGSGGGMDTGALELSEAGEPALIWIILEKLLYVAAAIFMVYLAVQLIIRLGAQIRRLVASIKELLARYLGAISADYVDETESFSGWDELGRKLGARLRRASRQFGREKAWRDMDNRERVRAAYRRLSRRENAPVNMTAREVLSVVEINADDAVRLGESYDKARYSEHEIADNEAEHARRVSQ